jgi:hypothetical protein
LLRVPPLGYLGLPTTAEAAGCAWCSSSTRCEAANYSGCATRTTKTGIGTCESWYQNCAWVYDATNLAPNGALVLDEPRGEVVATAEPDVNGRTVERGCGGVIVARTYSSEAETEVRATTAKLVI